MYSESDIISKLRSLSDQEYLRHLRLIPSTIDDKVNANVQQLFQYFIFDDVKNLEEFCVKGGLQVDRISLLLKEVWQASHPIFKISEDKRQKLKDLQWKLVVKTGGDSSAENRGTTFVQLQLLAEVDQQLKIHHLEVDLPTFYDFYHKLAKANGSITEIRS